jgi:hypothetical protein
MYSLPYTRTPNVFEEVFSVYFVLSFVTEFRSSVAHGTWHMLHLKVARTSSTTATRTGIQKAFSIKKAP